MAITISEGMKNYVSNKEKYAKLYSNAISDFVQKTFRKEYFQISKQKNSPKTENGVYIPKNYPRLVSSTYADFEVGEGVTAQFDQDNIQTIFDTLYVSNNVPQILKKMSQKKSALGYGIILVTKKKDQVRLVNIPVKNYFPDTEGLPVGSTTDDIKRHYIVSIISEKAKFFAVVHSYTLIEEGTNIGKWQAMYEKYNYTPQQSSKGFKFDNPIESDEEIFEHLPLFIFNNDIQNDEDFDFEFGGSSYSQAGQYFNCEFLGESDYADIIDMCLEINDRTTQVSIEHYKHLDSKMSYPTATIENRQKERDRLLKVAEKRGAISGSDAKSIKEGQNYMSNYEWFTHSPGEQPAQYITKDNSHLGYVEAHIESLLRTISAITRIPVHFFGLSEAAGNARVGLGIIQAERFHQRIMAKRESSRPTIQLMYAYMIFLETGTTYEIPTITFPKITVKDLQVVSETMTLLKSSGLVSTETAVGLSLDITGEELTKEMEKINQEASVNTAIQPGGDALPTL